MVTGTQPKAVLMENVYGPAYKRSRHHLDRFLARMDEAGYEMRWRVMLAADQPTAPRRTAAPSSVRQPGADQRGGP